MTKTPQQVSVVPKVARKEAILVLGLRKRFIDSVLNQVREVKETTGFKRWLLEHRDSTPHEGLCVDDEVDLEWQLQLPITLWNGGVCFNLSWDRGARWRASWPLGPGRGGYEEAGPGGVAWLVRGLEIHAGPSGEERLLKRRLAAGGARWCAERGSRAQYAGDCGRSAVEGGHDRVAEEPRRGPK
ncbi:hypothetical protein NDU88_002842 [Pleurodeles waltl]|uniref:Uncharacterized protein n=1 Tax=Pleurodeles waltl TaxID=8319 RepID=A0AAV7RB63_PLEWA|nr:hypothetical protein NDU88_002842 [Pleurodeles waltl]